MKTLFSINIRQVVFFLAAILALAPGAWAADYYASPTGNGDGKSTATPFQINSFWRVALPGDTLYLMDGIYTSATSMLIPPAGKSGLSGKPITVRALNDGKATISGNYERGEVVHLVNNDYFDLEGFNACALKQGGTSRGLFHVEGSDHVNVRRIVAWDADPLYNTCIFQPTGSTNILFEDCAGWGPARKIFVARETDGCTFRRCFARWTYYNTAEWNWTGAISYSYGGVNTTVENCVATWDEYPSVTAADLNLPAIFMDDDASANGGYKILGCIAYNLISQNGEPWQLWRFANRSKDTNYIIRDCIGYTDKTNIDNGKFVNMAFSGANLTFIGGAGGETKYALNVISPLSAPMKNIIQQQSSIRGINDGLQSDYVMFYNNTGENWGTTAPAHYKIENPNLIGKCGNILQYGLAESNRPKVGDVSVGAKIQNRYVNGVLTDEPLWPWPMDDRIREAMIQSGYDKKGGLDGKGGLNLTEILFTLGGGSVPNFGDTTPLPVLKSFRLE